MDKYIYQITKSDDGIWLVNSFSKNDNLNGHPINIDNLPEEIKSQMDWKILLGGEGHYVLSLERPFISYF